MDGVELIRSFCGVRHKGALVVAELGINHNGQFQMAKNLITAAHSAGADLVKMQLTRGPGWIPLEQRDNLREWNGEVMTYAQYREKLEFTDEDLSNLNQYSWELGLPMFYSAMDVNSMDWCKVFDPPCYKIPSCKAIDLELLACAEEEGKPVLVSTGMSTHDEIVSLFPHLGINDVVMHCVSSYPTNAEDCNLRVMEWLGSCVANHPGLPVGYSGHERGYQITLAAVAMGARMVERHLTLDRTLPGTDQASSLEPVGFGRMVRDIRVVEAAMGDGVKRLLPCEEASRKKLRGSFWRGSCS